MVYLIGVCNCSYAMIDCKHTRQGCFNDTVAIAAEVTLESVSKPVEKILWEPIYNQNKF